MVSLRLRLGCRIWDWCIFWKEFGHKKGCIGGVLGAFERFALASALAIACCCIENFFVDEILSKSWTRGTTYS